MHTLSTSQVQHDFMREFYERIHIGLTPNLDLLDLRPGTIVAQSRTGGQYHVTGTLDERAAAAESVSPGARHYLEEVLARVAPPGRGARGGAAAPTDDFPPIACNFKSEGVSLGDLTTNERAPICPELARCHTLMKFELARDALFSTAEGTTWRAFREPDELAEVWRIAEPLLREDESLVCGVALCPQLVAYVAATPGAVIGFVCDVHVDPDHWCSRLADLFVAHPLEVKVHSGEVLAVDAHDCVAMFSARPKAPRVRVSPQTV